MSNNDRTGGEFNLSNDAKRAADEFTNRIASELLLRSQLYAESRGSRVIERRDVYVASREFELPSGPPKETKRRWLIAWAGGVGLAVSVGLGVVLVLSGLAQADKVASAMGALVGLLGLAVSLTAFKKENPLSTPSVSIGIESRTDTRADAGELIAVWRDIEGLMRDDAPDGVDSRRRGIGLLVGDFAQRHDLGADFVNEVRRLLSTRNRLVHDAGEPVTQDEIAESLREAQRLVSVVKRITGAAGASTDSP
ncbi:hypothetical protein OG612_06380 [Streptomyces sp. NBC_01527]|uniref:hypothetical protein n=1 Tax=Streptomyces sp. NBC_01527 TaxID=2903894 RepID=UPI00386DFFF2